MKSTTLAILAALSAAFPAAASPEGSWPWEARGASLPKPAWVLVVAARRAEDGGVTAWDRADPWTRAWVVPKPTPGGIRTVAVTGDAEDQRTVSAFDLDGMDVGALARLAGKYGAPAVAVAVVDPAGETAVAGWSRGRQAVWDVGAGGGEARDAALSTIDALFAGAAGGGSPSWYAEAEPEATPGPRVEITGVRSGPSGDEYRIESDDESAVEALWSSPGVRVVERVYGGRPAAVVTVGGGSVEQVLRAGGFAVGPAG